MHGYHLKYHVNWYNLGKGWDATNNNWYSVTVNLKDFDMHIDILDWIYENVENAEKHMCWKFFIKESIFRFRYERDFILFKLRWE